MPRQYAMSWEGEPHYRWVKMVKGTRHRVSCDDLKTPRNKEASYVAANEWWDTKRKELEGVLARVSTLVDANDRYVELRREEKQLREKLTTAIDSLDKANHSPETTPLQMMMQCPELDALLPTPSLTLQPHVDSFLEVLGVKRGGLTVREITWYLNNLAKTATWNIADLDESVVQKTYVEIGTAKLSDGRKKKLWGFFKRFVTWLAEQGTIAQPRNLHSRSMSFDAPAQEVKTYAIDEVKKCVAGFTSRQRLYAMLGLNCGCTSADIGQLTWDMLKGDQLTRRRVKTKKKDKVPTVTYKLWAETMALLEEHKSTHETLILVGETGNSLWCAAPYKDQIGKAMEDSPIPMHSFRSIGSNLLDQYDEGCSTLFLAHAPVTVKHKHYTAPNQTKFFEALSWLRKQLT